MADLPKPPVAPQAPIPPGSSASASERARYLSERTSYEARRLSYQAGLKRYERELEAWSRRAQATTSGPSAEPPPQHQPSNTVIVRETVPDHRVEALEESHNAMRAVVNALLASTVVTNID